MNEKTFRANCTKELSRMGIDEEETQEKVEKKVQIAREISKMYGMDIKEVFDLLKW